ncbi:unnamed protein product [Protopolystoma xenopodis]|uniref:G-protein coupled receptors family 1 profile domain-containing protein n=1 Tax=Protopolystoma xenopodis TaxID=117903 RepID=A0A3S5CGU9_9PLAT|nr:unnamed protein product [Protopolystoma xenopodis]
MSTNGTGLFIEDTKVHLIAPHRYQIIETCLSAYCTLLLVIGLPGNLISGIIMGTDPATRKTTRLLMIVLSTADTAVLLTAVLRYWMTSVFHWDPRDTSSLACKVHTFAVSCASDFAVGSLCSIAVERFLVVAFPQKSNLLVRVSLIIIGMLCFTLCIFMKNLVLLLFMNVTQRNVITSSHAIPIVNKNSQTIMRDSGAKGSSAGLVCHLGGEYTNALKAYIKYDFLNFSVFPYIILFSCNVFIYFKLCRQRKMLLTHRTSQNISSSNENTNNKSKSTSKKDEHKLPLNRLATEGINNSQQCDVPNNVIIDTASHGGGAALITESRRCKKRKPENVIKILTALTLIHVICTLPATLFTFWTEYFPSPELKKKSHSIQLVKKSLNLLLFTNNTINFLAYWASSICFRRKVRAGIAVCFSRCGCNLSDKSTSRQDRTGCDQILSPMAVRELEEPGAGKVTELVSIGIKRAMNKKTLTIPIQAPSFVPPNKESPKTCSSRQNNGMLSEESKFAQMDEIQGIFRVQEEEVEFFERVDTEERPAKCDGNEREGTMNTPYDQLLKNSNFLITNL